MGALVFDDDLAEQLESVYRTRDILRRRLVRRALAASPDERILDVGCGRGFYVAELLEEVGDTGSVVGVDSSPQNRDAPHLILGRRRRAIGAARWCSGGTGSRSRRWS